MNIAEETVEWLFRDQLQVDEQWSYRLPTGFTWWADRYAQTVEILGEETGPSGEPGYLVGVRTELLREVELTDAVLESINGLPMRAAALAGPVYDVQARMLDLCSLIRVTDDNGPWVRHLLAAAAVAQIAEARLLAPVLAEAVGARPAVSDHPESGARTDPDEMAYAASVFVKSGEMPCAWLDSEFAEVIGRGVNKSSGLAGSVDGRGIRVELPFGDRTSLCRLTGDQPHPLYGNGLLLLQRFPVELPSDAEGVGLALSLNAADLCREVSGYGLGSYVFADGAVHFTGFLPNALHRPGLLSNLFASCAARAHMMAARFTEGRWDGDAYSLDAAVLARRADRLRTAAPAVERPRGCPMMRARSGGA